jgi:NADH dehydrogenase/NADH:ubiquinone oxidoreductase subunit G
MRILPIYNKSKNEDWITNKIRFIYDSNLYQRINYPLIKVNNTFINISWINAFNLFFLNLFKYDNKYVILGSFSDYESIFNIKQFFNLLGNNVYFESNVDNFSSDFLNDIYTLINLEDTKFLLMISLNLRLEMPILNSKLMRKKDKITFYSIGNVGYFYSNYFKYLGNSVLEIIKFIFGKTELNKQVFNIFSFDVNIFNKKFKPSGLNILIGQSFYFIKNSFMLYNKLKLYVYDNFNFSWCSNLFSNVSVLNYLNLNHLKRFVFNNKSGLYFLNNVDNYYYSKNINKENNFIIYRGSFFDETARYSDLIFPSNTFFEENLNYKSFDGLNVYTRKVVSTNLYNNKEFFFF